MAMICTRCGNKVFAAVIGICIAVTTTAPRASAVGAKAPVDWQSAVAIPGAGVRWLHAMITYRPFTVTVRNEDKFDWINAEFECAPAGDSYDGRFYYHGGTIKGGQVVQIPIERFHNSKGDEMPLANPKKGIMAVKCETPDHHNGSRRQPFGSTYDPAR